MCVNDLSLHLFLSLWMRVRSLIASTRLTSPRQAVGVGESKWRGWRWQDFSLSSCSFLPSASLLQPYLSSFFPVPLPLNPKNWLCRLCKKPCWRSLSQPQLTAFVCRQCKCVFVCASFLCLHFCVWMSQIKRETPHPLPWKKYSFERSMAAMVTVAAICVCCMNVR